MGIRLQWLARPGADDQRIYRSLVPFTPLDPPPPIAVVGPAVSSYNDTVPEPGVPYWYAVSVRRGARELFSKVVRQVGGQTVPVGEATVIPYEFDFGAAPAQFVDIDFGAINGTVFRVDVAAWDLDFDATNGSPVVAQGIVGAAVRSQTTDYNLATWSNSNSDYVASNGFRVTGDRAVAEGFSGICWIYGLGRNMKTLCAGQMDARTAASFRLQHSHRTVAEVETGVRFTGQNGAQLIAGKLLVNVWAIQ